MEEINITDIVQNQNKPITPMQQIVTDVQARNPKVDRNTPKKSLGVDFGEDLLFGTGIKETPQKASLSYENTNMESAFANVGGEWLTKYDSYKRGRDNDEYAGQTQTTGDKWANGITKAGAKTVNAVIGGTVGIVYGAGAAIAGLDPSKFYDNNFSNWMNDVDAKLNYQLPNYYTKQEENKGVFGQMTTANFWADKFLGGLSFTAGAIVSEGIWAWATGGTSLATSATRWGSKIAGLGRVGKWGVAELGETAVVGALAKNKGLLRTFELGADASTASLAGARQTAVTFGKVGEVASIAGRTMRSAGYEASVEALQYKKEAEENFYRNFANQNGREPSQEEVAQFESENNTAANAVFGANMAIVGTSNLILLGNVLNIKNPVNLGFNDFINKKAFGYGVDKATNTVIKGTTLQKVNRNVFNYLVKPSATEGLFEEGLQGVTNKTANKWIEHTYDTKNSAETFSALESFGESLNEQYGTEEGWKENVLGMLIGIAGGSVNVRAEDRAKAREYDMQAKSARTYDNKTLQELVLPLRVQTANRMQGFAQEEQQEESKGNLAKSQMAKVGQITSYINSELVMGESVKSTTKKVSEALDSMTEEQWAEMGVEAENIETEKTERISEFQTLAQEWKTNKNYVKYMIGDKMVGEKDLNAEQTTALEELYGNFSNNAKVVEALTWQLTVGENATKIMRDVQATIGKEIGAENEASLKIVTQLKSRSLESNRELNNLQKRYASAVQRRDSLEKRLINEQNAQKKSTERDGSLYRQLSLDFVNAEEEVTKAKEEADAIAEELNVNQETLNANEELDRNLTPIGNVVSGEQLLKLNENTKKFQDTLKLLESTNNPRFKYLNGIIEEYQEAESMFMQAKSTQKALMSPEFKITNIDGWVGNLFSKGKSMHQDTKDWFEGAINSYLNDKARVLNAQEKQEEVVEEVVETPKDLTKTEKKSAEQIAEEEIAELETEREVKLALVPADVIEVKPKPFDKQAEISRLEGRIARLAESNGRDSKVDEFAKENNDDVLEFSKEPFNGSEALVYQTKQDNTWSDKGSSFVGTWDVLKFYQGSNAHVRVLMTPQQKASYDKTDKKGFSKALRDFAKTNAKTNTVVLLDIRPKQEDNSVEIENLNKELEEIKNREEVEVVEEAPKESESQKKIDKINKEYDEKISQIRGKSKIEEYKERIKNLLSNVYKSLDYLPQTPTELSAVKPTKEEIQEYNDLVKDGKATTKKAQELRARLNDWKLLSTAVDEDYTSIADLIDLINQLEASVDIQETKPEVTDSEVSTTMNTISSENEVGLGDIKGMLNNTNQPVTARKIKDIVQLSHVKARYIVEQLGGDFTIVRGKKVISNKNIDTLEPGDVVTADGLSFRIDDTYRLVFNINDFNQARQIQTNLYIEDGESSLNFISVYSIFGTERVRAQSQFSDENINTEESFKVQEGDKLTLHVKDTDGWNASEKGGTMDEMKIYVKDGVGNIVGNLKSGKAKKGAEIDPDFMAIRKQAFDVWELQGKPENLDLGITVSAGSIFLGSAQIAREEMPISKEAVERVVIAQGYVLGDDITLDNKSLKDVNLIYVKKIAKDNKDRKIPVVVFRRGNHSIAFPISLQRKPSPLDLESLLQGTPQEMVLKINKAISDNNVEVEKLNFSDLVLDNSGEIVVSENVEKVRKAFENHTMFKTADELASEQYDKTNLTADATIRIDLEDLPSAIVSPKIRIDLKSATYSNTNEVKYTQMSELEKAMSDAYKQMESDLFKNSATKYLDKKGEILESSDHPYIEYLEDNPPMLENDNLAFQFNGKRLRELMQVKISKPLRAIIGEDVLDRAKKMIDTYNLVRSQQKADKEKTKEGKNNC